MNGNGPTSLTADTSKARLLTTELIQTGEIGQAILLNHRHRVVVFEATLECLLHQWNQRMESTCIKHLTGVQSGHIGITTINPLHTFVRVEALFAGDIKEIVLE